MNDGEKEAGKGEKGGKILRNMEYVVLIVRDFQPAFEFYHIQLKMVETHRCAFHSYLADIYPSSNTPRVRATDNTSCVVTNLRHKKYASLHEQ